MRYEVDGEMMINEAMEVIGQKIEGFLFCVESIRFYPEVYI